MKNFKLFLVAAIALVSFAACGGDDTEGPTPGPNGGTVVGQWQLTDYSGVQGIAVYVEFKADGAFDLYQRLDTSAYEHFTGSYKYDGSKLTGKYSDGIDWATSYKVSFSGDNMTLTGESGDVSVYTKTTIPVDVTVGTAALQSRADGFRIL